MYEIDNFTKILVVSAAFSETQEIIRDLNASREIYNGWDVHFIGSGQKMISYVDAKIIQMQKFLNMNIDKFDWVIMIDSNDTILTRNFIESEIINILESFNKPIIFSGEANLYPMKEFNGLYTSKSIIRYLNAGCIAVRKNYINILFDYAIKLYNKFPEYSRVGWNPPGDQTYYQLCLFSKEIGEYIKIDDTGLLSVSTALVPDSYFSIDKNMVYFENNRPYILHFQGNDKHERKRKFMKDLSIPIRG